MLKLILLPRRGYATKPNLSKLRNIGVIAHIDAGKTTTTERMLYYSGKTNRIGNVDQGDTVTDFLPQERSRGITIQSAAISFNWQNDYRINLIDTPGHVDFTFEVIKALKVLDGCVAILDAVAGVESQTEKVWKQSVGIPKICFINKMDRVGAGFSRAVKELIVKMNQRVALVNIPVFKMSPGTEEEVFEGVLDVVNMKILRWKDGNPDAINISDIYKTDEKLYDQLYKSRESLIETLGEFDEKLVEYFLEEAEGDYLKVPATLLNESIKKATLAHFVTPVLWGSSFKNIGVQPLLDAVINYLPSPLEAKFPEINKNLPMKYDSKLGIIINNNNDLSVSVAFKVITDAIRGIMVFVRVYSGVLKSGNTVYNSTNGKKFKIGKPVIMHADVPEDIQSLSAGEIGVLTGSSIVDNIETGDTIVTHSIKRDGLKSLNSKNELELKINPIVVPPPVFSVCIEPKTLGNKQSMESALKILIREDPSLHVTKDADTGQTLLSGMGELHLEIARDKLLNELNANVDVGKLMVSYRETINMASVTESYSDDSGYSFNISVEPNTNLFDLEELNSNNHNETWYSLGIDDNYLVLEKNELMNPNDDWDHQLSYQVIVNTLLSSCIASFQKGGQIANFPLQSCTVRVKGDWTIPRDVSTSSEILSIFRRLILKALGSLNEMQYSVLEPVMNVEVISPQNSLGNIIQDLTGSRKADILSIEDEDEINKTNNGNGHIEFLIISENQYLPPDNTLKLARLDESSTLKMIKARSPLKDMVAYSNKLRSLTQGRGAVYMSYYGMEKVPREHLESVLKQ